jgi:hypothetical protein
MHALTKFIQRPYGQASLLAKSCPHQSTRFKLRKRTYITRLISESERERFIRSRMTS